MNALRKHLFKLLMAVACLGIANEALAQQGPGSPIGVLDTTFRGSLQLQLPFVRFDATLTSSVAGGSTERVGANGIVAITPYDGTAANGRGIGTGTTLTSSIGALPYASRLKVMLVGVGATQLRCDTLQIDGADQYGREVGPSGAIARYSFQQLTTNAVHTTSIAFSKVTRIRLNNCYSGNNCPGSSCTSAAPPGGTQLRVLMTNHIGLPFRAASLSDVLEICREGLGTAAGTGSAHCFKSDALTPANSGSTSAAFGFNVARNTLIFFPSGTSGAAAGVRYNDGVSTTSFSVTDLFQPRDRYVIYFKAAPGFR